MSLDSKNEGHREPSSESLQEIPLLSQSARQAGPRGKYAARMRDQCNVVTIDEDLRELFPTERAVNDALRALAEAMPQEMHSGSNRLSRPPRFPQEERQDASDYDQPKQTVVIHDDVADIFKNEQGINTALRAAAAIFQQLEARRA